MSRIDVDLITKLMQYSKNLNMIEIETINDMKYRGVINSFDGTAVLLDSGEKIVCDDIKTIVEKEKPNYSELIGKRVHIKDCNGRVYDGVLYDVTSSEIHIITEKGVEKVDIKAFDEIKDSTEVVNVKNESDKHSKDNESLDEKSDKDNLNNTGSVDTQLESKGFHSELIEGSFYVFEEKLSDIQSLTENEHKECINKFNEQEYHFVLNFLNKKQFNTQEQKLLEKITEYLKQVIERFEKNKNNFIPDGSLFYKGLIASKIELNLDKGYRFFVESFEENPELKKNAIYHAIVVYLFSKNYERAAEVCSLLIGELKSVEPKYDQATSLKTMLNVYMKVENWNEYLDILEYLVLVAKSHPVSCSNLIIRYLTVVEKNIHDVRIENIYANGIKLETNITIMLLRFANYLASVYGYDEIENHINKHLNNSTLKDAWNDVKAKHLLGMLEATDRYAYIEIIPSSDEFVKHSSVDEKNKDENSGKKEYDNEDRPKEVGEKSNIEPIEESFERELKKYISKNDYRGAKGHFAGLLKKHDSDNLYKEFNLRAELYSAQYTAFKNSKNLFSERYSRAMSKWLVEHLPLEAERLFMEDILADSPNKGTTILSYIDMVAVEFGLSEAIKVLLDLQQEIKYCERNEKIAFYEKKYNFSFCYEDIPNALNALETLRSTYYNKMKLGNCWYRSGECYRKQLKWKHAKNCYEKAIDYGYMKNACEHQILICRRNMGELVNSVEKSQVVELESVEVIRGKIDSYYNQIQYKEANNYIAELADNHPENEEVLELARSVAETFQRFIDSGTSMPKRKDRQAIALRAWHIENNYGKAKEYFEEEIINKGSKYISCIMDLSELLRHTEGLEAAIQSLESYERTIKELKVSEQSGYYEKLYLMYQKEKNVDKMIYVLDELLNIYSSIDRKDKVAFSYYRSAVACYQSKYYEQTISKMLMAINGGYHNNLCYKCVAFSYAYIGKYEDAMSFIQGIKNNQSDVDSNLQLILKEIEEQVNKIKDNSSELETIESKTENDDLSVELLLSFNTRYEAFFVERYGTKPVGISVDKFEQSGYKESDIIRLEKEAWQHKLRERTGFFGTAAYIENQVNGNSYKYYELLRNSANSWGLELQNNGYFDCACVCFEFSLENDIRTGKLGERSVVNYLSCIARRHKYNMPDTDEEIRKDTLKLISNIMELNGVYGENVLKELILIINKSKYIREVLIASTIGEKKVWISQLANYLSETDTPSDYTELFDVIQKKCWQDENALLDFSNKIRTSKVFNEEQFAELRSFKNIVFLFDLDIKYLDSLMNAYEKGIEIYDYEDYDNRMATIGNVHNQLSELMSKLDIYPTYFGINFLAEIIENLLEIIVELTKKTKDELKPELTAQIPIADVPVVEGKQGLSVTILNKENSASAKDVRLKVADVDGVELTDDILIAQYLKGGRSASKELDIPSQGETYTVKLIVSYIDHEDNKQSQESLVSISSANEIFEPIISPYFTGDSIDVNQPSIFVGRDVLLDTLENALVNNRSGCEIIYGQKRCGKSSIANFLEDRLKDKFLIIKFSIGAARSTKSIYTNVKDLIIEKIDDLLEEDIPGIDEDLLDEIENRNIADDEDFVSFIRLVHRKLCKHLGKEILLMIDEFTHLYRYVKEDRRQVAAFMDTWKKLLEADLFKAVLIGQDTMPNFIKEFQNQFQVTQPIRVDRLDDESVRELIEEPLRLSSGETRFMENSVDLIASWFFGQPYYIQLYCDKLVKQMNIDKRVRVTNALAEKVKSLMLEEAEEDLFDNLISRGDESGTEGECYEILKRIALLTKNSEWAEIDDIQIEKQDVLINDLINRAVIRKKDNKCKILISFFREWLNMN